MGLPWWLSDKESDNAGDMSSIPGPGRSHMPQSSSACAVGHVSESQGAAPAEPTRPDF